MNKKKICSPAVKVDEWGEKKNEAAYGKKLTWTTEATEVLNWIYTAM